MLTMSCASISQQVKQITDEIKRGQRPPPIASHRIASHRIASHRIASHRIASQSDRPTQPQADFT
jgi:hypothetical protein